MNQLSLKHQYNLTETLDNGAALPAPVRDGYRFVGWENKHGETVTTAKCNGNLKAISKLVEGKNASEISNLLRGNTCGPRPTSCADQLSIALMNAINE